MFPSRLLAFLLFLVAISARGFGQFIPMGSLSKDNSSSEALGITKDGYYVVGWAAVDHLVDGTNNTSDNAVSWYDGTLATLIGANSPYTDIGSVPQFNFVSNDKATLLNTIAIPQLVWIRGSITSFAGSYELVNGLAPDGTYVVGVHYEGTLASGKAFYQEPSDISPTYLPTPAGYTDSIALASSNEGSVIVGEVTTSTNTVLPVYWDAKGIHVVPLPKGVGDGSAEAVNSDGTIIAGEYLIGQVAYGFVYHTGATSLYRTFDPPAGVYMNDISEMSDDGSVVVGTSTDGYSSTDNNSYGWIWDIDSPARAQEAGAYLTSKGAAPTMAIYSVNGISGDGDTIIGDMSPDQTNLQGWKAIIDLKTHAIGLTFDPVQPKSGDKADTGTIQIDRPSLVDPFVVKLSSSDPNLVGVPASVTVPANETEADFKLTIGATSLPQNVTITAIDSLNDKLVYTLSVLASPLGNITITPGAVTGGVGSKGSVEFNTASTADETITLESDNTNVVTVPKSLTMPANQTSLGFDVTTKPVKTTTAVTITATCDGVSDSKTVTVQEAVIVSVNMKTPSVASGATDAGTVTLTGQAPTGGATVTLTSSNPAAATVPKSVIIAANATTGTFTLTSNAVTANANVTITGAYLGSKTAYVIVVAPPLTGLTIKTPTISGGASDSGTVTLGVAAPSPGIPVSLTSSAPTLAIVPATATVASKSTTGSFTFTTKGVSAATKVTITAKLGTASKTATVLLEPPVLSSVSLTPASLTGTVNSVGTVTLTGKTAAAATVKLASSNTSVATVPATVVIGVQASAVTFAVTTKPVSQQLSVLITATVGTTAKSATLIVKPAVLSGVKLTSSSVIGSVAATGAVTLNAKAGTGTSIDVSSSSTLATVPGIVTVLTGASTANFAIATKPVSATTPVSIKATQGSLTFTTTLTLLVSPISSVTLVESSIVGGASTSGTITLEYPAGAAGDIVALKSSSPLVVVPTSATVLANGRTAVFSVKSSKPSASTSVTITASLGTSVKTFVLTVNP